MSASAAEWAYRGVARSLGVLSPPSASAPRADLLLHGASAGEVKAARALLPPLRQRLPACSVLLTTSTARGLAAGAQLRRPLDAPQATARFLDDVRPRALVLVEGELWPTLLRLAAERGLPASVVGARMSPRSAQLWARAPRLAATLLERVTAFAASSGDDAERLVRLGAPRDAVAACGWLKWPEAVAAAGLEARRAELAERLPGAEPLLVLGSVHPGEVTAFARALRGGALDPARSRWVIVARHPGAAPRLRRESAGFPRAWVEERFGVLRSWFGVADAAAVGGGARGRGSHDLLEPLQAGLRPLFFAGRGDPGGAGSSLQALGCATRLDGPNGVADPLAGPPLTWDDLKARFDGRAAALDFLQQRGALP